MLVLAALVFVAASVPPLMRSQLVVVKIRCSCLGGFDLPVSTVTLPEDALMAATAAFMALGPVPTRADARDGIPPRPWPGLARGGRPSVPPARPAALPAHGRCRARRTLPMRPPALMLVPLLAASACLAAGPLPEPLVVARPDAFKTLVNPACSHCRDEAKRRAGDLKPGDRVLSWTRGYSDGGVIPFRFFLVPYRVVSDSYGVFVHDPEAGYARGFAASYDFRFHGWRNGVMAMRHKDGTLYSCLSGLAFAGPRKGTRLAPVPTVVSDWGWWLDKYPDAVAYRMFDKYRPAEPPAEDDSGSVKSRGKPDPRLKAGEEVLGVWTGKAARAYPVASLERGGIVKEDVGGGPLVVLWEPRTRTAAAYRPVASQPRKYKGPMPDESGVSKPDAGVPAPAGARVVPARKLALGLAPAGAAGRFQDAETKSLWDVAGRCVEGELKGWTLEWVDGVQARWFAWSAEHPGTTVWVDEKAEADKKVKEVAGTSEFLRLLPKPFGVIKGVDPKARTVTFLADGDKEARTWPLEPDAEVKVGGWWGRLEQFKAGDRAWAWLKLDRKKKPTSVVMLADDLSEFDMHGSLGAKPGGKPRIAPEKVEAGRKGQRAWLRKRWADEGLPGTLTFHHVFSGELELALDHEAMRWGRSLAAGDVVHLAADPPIKAVVKAVTPWRERTVVRLVVGELESSELKAGQRLSLKMAPPGAAVEDSPYPPDMGRERSRAERIEWVLASTYCTCGVSKDVCTGHFYTLASCNPNGCGLPKGRRRDVGAMIDKGLTDRQILDRLLESDGPLVLRPHLLP